MGDDQYNSQPIRKPSSWILDKWRRPKNTEGSSSSEQQNPAGNQPDNFQRPRNRWAIPDDESHNWSETILDFYNHGDKPFCYSAVFFREAKLDKRFWGSLLGFRNNGYLLPEHFEGWVGRLMKWRNRELASGFLECPPVDLRRVH
ncbi:hypothetical protein L1987_51040 [Smallanthus sonchifolius]|uniref:Uncharacterized protein n=1 Tax=Smallanthus sonchifolius TaxID=185202 RepID=A0ACB9EP52_9ASTR|nr:hypothetical protein L1987_51040 [Smallanthus sonchifolius]